MTAHIHTGPAILIGYAYHLRLEAAADIFPEAARLAGHVRATPTAAHILATLSTEAGSLVRVSDHELDVCIPSEATAQMSVGFVVLDLVRQDVDPDLHLGFALEIPVMLPITRGLG